MDQESHAGSARAAGLASESPGRARIALWLVTVTLAGGIIMGLELAAFRLYAPYFGYSIYVWGSMISVVMAALAGGYALGGWLADRSRNDAALYWMLLASGGYQVIIVYTARSVLLALWQSGEFTGTVLATLVIFAPSMTTLATSSPFVIRLLARAGHVGSTAGKVYALSTVGSIAGVLATSFILVPHFGTHRTLQSLCAASTVVGVAGLVLARRAASVALLTLVAAVLAHAPSLPSYEIWRAESAYNLVRVLRSSGYLLLALNQVRYSHTTRKENQLWSGSYQDHFALGPLLVPARRLLVLGMGGGGSILATRITAPEISTDAVEIDPKVVEGATRFFGLRPEASRLRIHVADARPWLAREHSVYDLVHVDLYHGGPYVPFYLDTVEFYRQVSARTSREGLLMMNVYDLSQDRELLNATVATLKNVFPTVASLSRADGNHVLFVFPRARTITWIRRQLESNPGDEKVAQLAREAAAGISEPVPPAGTPVFTDDRAPVEELTRRMLARLKQ